MKSINLGFFKIVRFFGIIGFAIAGTNLAFATYNIGMPLPNKKRVVIREKMAGCLPATQQKDLDVNNVRTTILNGGDMWWNLSNARYEIPKVQVGQVSKNSLFSGALWIGGVANGNLKIAAQTYRQSGNDFYPGPLVKDDATISESRCKDFDKIFRVTLNEITTLVNTDDKNNLEISEDIENWPGNGNVLIGEAARLAPFYDVDSNGIYDARSGDYPILNDGNPDLSNIPDMMMFMIYNDKGNIHSESGGVPIGLEFIYKLSHFQLMMKLIT